MRHRGKRNSAIWIGAAVLAATVASHALADSGYTAYPDAASQKKKSSPKDSSKGPDTGRNENSCKTCLERRPTLDPKLFVKGHELEVALAYEAARRYPATVDRIHCFCECKESSVFKHKSLLTCFTDWHAAGCGICINEALAAATLKERGMPDDQVKGRVEGTYRTDGHAPTQDPRR